MPIEPGNVTPKEIEQAKYPTLPLTNKVLQETLPIVQTPHGYNIFLLIISSSRRTNKILSNEKAHFSTLPMISLMQAT